MSKKRINRKLKELAKECERLSRKADAGTLTDEVKRRKCNELAHEYLQLSNVCKKSFNPFAAAYIEHACIKLATELKLLAVTPSESKRKGYDIKRKVIIYPKMEGWQ